MAARTKGAVGRGREGSGRPAGGGERSARGGGGGAADTSGASSV